MILLSFAVGKFPVSPADLLAVLWAKLTGGVANVPPTVETVVWQVRMPRVLAGILVGAALAAAGATYQGLFRNPLVSPEPRVLVMDEPTASLDFGNQVKVLHHLRRLAAQGIAVVLSTHDPDHAFLCADRVALLHDGRLVALGAPETTITSASLRLLYGVDVAVVRLDAENRHVCVPRDLSAFRASP